MNPQHGAFGIACVAHQFMGFRWTDESFEVPMNSGNLPLKVTSEWASGKNKKSLVDTV
jgi:hypothetical protein